MFNVRGEGAQRADRRGQRCIPQGTYATRRAVVTRGVNDLGPDLVFLATRAAGAFNDFTEENDPYGEHDFGSFELGGLKLFWKIDCYEKGSDYEAGADTPDNPATTSRVLTDAAFSMAQ